MFGMRYVFYEVTRNLLPFHYEAFRNSNKQLTVVATDMRDGKAFYKTIGDIEDDNEMLYLCASAAIPMASTAVRVDGRVLMDGGASDSIPIEYSMGKGNENNVVVVTRCRGYRARKGPLSNMPYLLYPRHRAFARTVANRFGYYNKSLDILDEQEAAGNAVVLYPSRPVEVDRFERDPEKMLALYQNGCDDAMAVRDKLRDFLKDSETVDIDPAR
jgi:predicted patatin/cPLA2 family phospholipase